MPLLPLRTVLSHRNNSSMKSLASTLKSPWTRRRAKDVQGPNDRRALSTAVFQGPAHSLCGEEKANLLQLLEYRTLSRLPGEWLGYDRLVTNSPQARSWPDNTRACATDPWCTVRPIDDCPSDQLDSEAPAGLTPGGAIILSLTNYSMDHMN
jgi:hypothetical protein